MNKKIILSISLIVLIGLVVVSAVTSEITKSEIRVEKGWNLVNLYVIEDIFDVTLGNNENYQNYLDNLGLKAAFVYDNKNKKYIRLYPNKEINKVNDFINNIQDPSEPIIDSMWVYMKESKTITFDEYDLSYNSASLVSSWNFISITPDMVGRSLNEIKGSCDIEKVYGWNNQEISGGGNWDSISLTYKFGENVVSRGILIKVSSNCNLGTSTDGTNPPVLPSGDTDTSYFPKTIGTYVKSDIEDFQPGIADTCGEYPSVGYICMEVILDSFYYKDDEIYGVGIYRITEGFDLYSNHLKEGTTQTSITNVMKSDIETLIWVSNDNVIVSTTKYEGSPNGAKSSVEIEEDNVVSSYFMNKYPPIQI